jgi:hypothetical protein
MPVPLIKARGQQRRMTENKNHCLAATPECGEWPGAKPCRMIPFPITPGGWAGRVFISLGKFFSWVIFIHTDQVLVFSLGNFQKFFKCDIIFEV